MHIRVYGKPAPQGSKTNMPVMAGSGADKHPTGAFNLVESSSRVKGWRQDVQRAAEEQRQGQTFPRGVPVSAIVQFYLPRPKNHYRTGKHAGLLRDSAPPYPAGRGLDIDKLLRAVLDGLTAGGVWGDDGQVATVMMGRFYADDSARPGVEIWVTRARPPGPSDERQPDD